MRLFYSDSVVGAISSSGPVDAVLDYFDLLTQKKNTYPAKFGSHNIEFDLREKLGL